MNLSFISLTQYRKIANKQTQVNYAFGKLPFPVVILDNQYSWPFTNIVIEQKNVKCSIIFFF